MSKRSASGKKAMGSGSGSTKKAKTPRKGSSKLNEVQEDDETLDFSMDPDVLECRICFNPLDAEIYMCKNGHGACGNCCLHMNRKCGNKATPFVVLVQPGRGLVFLLLNGGDVLAGRSLSLVCLGPRPDGNAELEYKMDVTGDEPGALALSAAGTVPCARRLEGFQAKQFLFVPDAYWGSSGIVSVKVRV